MPRLRSLLPTVAGLLVAFTTMAAAQSDYPNRPVRLIIPFPPGGSNDVVGRMIGTQLSEQARQAGDRRQPRRRRRRDRHRDRLQGDAGRLHHPGHFARPRGQPLALQTAVRPDQGVRADRRDGIGAQRRRGSSRSAGPFDQGTGCARQAKARRPAIRLGRRRLASSISAPNCSSSKPASTSCMCRSRAAARP